MRARFRDRRNLKGEFIQNLSQGGVFVTTEHPLALGTKIELILEAPDGRTLPVDGVVVWSSAGEGKSVRSAAGFSGMGIRFTIKDPERQHELQDFIDSITKSV